MIIEAKQVDYIRGDSSILKNINWTVKEHEHWAVLGLNGSGKTTLLNMINGYIFPSNGSLKVLGKTFGKYDLRELRKIIGWVSSSLQERLYGKETALEIVLSGLFGSIGLVDRVSSDQVEKAKEILSRLSALHLSERLYGTLSQGEKQRILIGRALMADPALLILDEPCTGLDLFAKEKLLSVISELSLLEQAPTMIYVTHRTEEILPVFSHTLLLKNGAVFDSGKTQEMITEKKLRDFLEAPVNLHQYNKRYTITSPSD